MEQIDKVRKKIADVVYRWDYSGKALRDFAALPLHLQSLYLEEASRILAIPEIAILPERTPRTDLENNLADEEFARQYQDARIKSSWEIKMVELGYITPERHKAELEESYKAGMQKVADWVETHHEVTSIWSNTLERWVLIPLEWQAFLKENDMND